VVATTLATRTTSALLSSPGKEVETVTAGKGE